MPISVVSFSFSWCSTGGSAFCWVLAFSTTSCHQRVSETTGGPDGSFGREWLSLPHLISNFSGSQLIRDPKGPLRRAFSTTSYQQLLWTPTLWLPVFTELYSSSTPTQSSTQSLEWHVWSSSSGNNCHAVQRSLCSGASVYECIMGFFTLSHFITQICPRDLFRLLAIGMCHFLPVHHFGMVCFPGPKVKIQHVMVNKLDWDIVVSEFEFQSHYCVLLWSNNFGKGMNTPILPPPAMLLNSTSTVLQGWIWL